MQVDIEVSTGRFWESFGTKLYPGMYSPLVHAILKPGSDTLCLMVDHLSSEFRPNSMIAHEDITGIHLDRICTLGVSILLHNTA